MLAIADVHPTRAQTVIPSGTEVIAYVNGAWGDYHQVHLSAPGSGQDEPITDLPDWMTRPMHWVELSPDGTKVAFQAYSDTGRAYTIWVVPSLGGEEVQMLPSSWTTHFADWSPDSKKIVFLGEDGSVPPEDNPPWLWTVEVTEAGNVTPTPIDTGGIRGTGPIFNKDGTQVLFVGHGLSGGPNQIYSVPVTGGTPAPLTNFAFSHSPGYLTLSPDGQKLAYTANDSSGVRQVFTIPVSGGANPTQITYEESADVTDMEIGQSLAFSPDGTKILFNRYKISTQGVDGLYTVPTTGGSKSLVLNGPDLEGAADWGVVRGIDQTAPTVTSTVPADNAKGVSPTTNVKATFSEDMLVSSITGKTFKLFKQGSTTKIAATVRYNADTATLDPTNNLRRGVTYKAVVTTGAKDLAGNQLDQNPDLAGPQQKAWLFKIRS